jgi:hypothetical protein
MLRFRTAPTHGLSRFVFATALLAAAVARPEAQQPVVQHKDITFILPRFSTVVTAEDVAYMRANIGEGPYVKVGYSQFLNIQMNSWTVDTTDPAAVRAALAPTLSMIDDEVAYAKSLGVPIHLNLLTAIRSRVDPVQTSSQAEDIRSMQWYNDNGLATGWWSLSRYARKARGVQEAYVRELGKHVAGIMAAEPNTLVSVSSDGEVELSFDRSNANPAAPGFPFATPFLADYSPFAVKEFADWVRAAGLYAAGQPYAGQAYEFSGRYATDPAPGVDGNGDQRTFNGDFGTSFTSWNLRYADWSLADPTLSDPKAIPLAGGTIQDAGSGLFDAPRTRIAGNPWWELWSLFRQTMVWRHNQDYANWMTSNAGAEIPADRFYSYQIAADYLFGNSPDPSVNERFNTSASPWWSADLTPRPWWNGAATGSPRGGLGITAFNVNLGSFVPLVDGPYAKTLATVYPHIKGRNLRYALIEWNPSVRTAVDPDVYQDEMTLLEQYRPGLVAPFVWDDIDGLPADNPKDRQTKGTAFETALKDLVLRINNVPGTCVFTVPSSITIPAAGGSRNFQVATGAGCPWSAVPGSNSSFITITSGASGTGTGTVTYSVSPAGFSARSGTLKIAGHTFTVNQDATIPRPFDFSADGKADLAAFDTTTGVWSIKGQSNVSWGLPGDVPVPGDYDGNGVADVAVFRPANGQWFVNGQAPVPWGLPGDVPVPGDYNGDETTDMAVFRPATGQWFIRNQNNFQWGVPGDVAVPADYDGDGKTDLAVFRPSTRQWVLAYSSTGFVTNATFVVGQGGDVPVPGDFDGDGKADLAVFRPTNGLWFISPSTTNYTTLAVHAWGEPGDVPVALDVNGDGTDELVVFRASNASWWTYNLVTSAIGVETLGNSNAIPAGQRPQLPVPVIPRRFDFSGDGKADIAAFDTTTGVWSIKGQSNVQWGLAGDVPVPGDYNGNGVADIAVFRPVSGEWFVNGQAPVQWGLPGDAPVPGDYNGDETTDIAVYRPSTGQWFIRGQNNFQWGLPGDIPVPADYDGDDKTDLAVFRPSTRQWFLAYSATGFGTNAAFVLGESGDVPVPGDFDGDGKADLAVFRRTTGVWFMLLSTTNYATLAVQPWGEPGDVPLALDVNGDGTDELVVFRASNASWWTYNRVTGAISLDTLGSSNAIPAGQRPRLPIPVTARPFDFSGDGKADIAAFNTTTGVWSIKGQSNVQWGLSGDVPVPGDYNGNGVAEKAVFRPVSGEWFVNGQAPVQWALPDDVPVPGDYNGDKTTDIAVYRPSTGVWFIRGQNNFQWGLPGDVAVPADYDGDAKTDLAVFRPSTRQWFIAYSATGFGTNAAFVWGESGDVPTPGDFDGDGKADLAVFRPTNGFWIIALSTTNYATLAVHSWGEPGDLPLALDADGDGTDELVVFRSSNASWWTYNRVTGAIVVDTLGSSTAIPAAQRPRLPQ